jgi:hypothetical protein
MSFGPTSKYDPGSTPTVRLRFALRAAAASFGSVSTVDRGSAVFPKPRSIAATWSPIPNPVRTSTSTTSDAGHPGRGSHPEGQAPLRAPAGRTEPPRGVVQSSSFRTQGRGRPPRGPVGSREQAPESRWGTRLDALARSSEEARARAPRSKRPGRPHRASRASLPRTKGGRVEADCHALTVTLGRPKPTCEPPRRECRPRQPRKALPVRPTARRRADAGTLFPRRAVRLSLPPRTPKSRW